MRMQHRPLALVAGAVLALVLSAPASAVSLGSFSCITNNDAGDCAIGEAQLSADLTGNVLTITMTGASDAVVEQVFIEGAVTAGTFLSSGGVGIVDFNDAVAGGNLPGGTNVAFTEAINFAAKPAPPKNGIGRHPQDLTSGQSARFALVGDLSNLRIGVHVIGYNSYGSESFVTERAIPEPSSALLFGFGALAIRGGLRRKA